MKRFCLIAFGILLAAQASISLRAAAVSRGFTSTQIFNTPGKTGGGLVLNQPLPAASRPLPSATNQVQKVAAKTPLPKDVKVIPPPPKPKAPTTKDSRPIVDPTEKDKRPIYVKAPLDTKPTKVAPKVVKAKYDSTTYDRVGRVPNAGDRTGVSAMGIFTAAPPPKPRHHGFGDWP